jgi:hypothetical protein
MLHATASRLTARLAPLAVRATLNARPDREAMVACGMAIAAILMP